MIEKLKRKELVIVYFWAQRAQKFDAISDRSWEKLKKRRRMHRFRKFIKYFKNRKLEVRERGVTIENLRRLDPQGRIE